MNDSLLRSAIADPVVLVELFIVANLAFLSGDIYIAHSMNRFERWPEWIPFVYSLIAPVVLVGTMFRAGSARPDKQRMVGRTVGLIVGSGAVLVGVAGLLWHLESQFFNQQTLKSLIYTAPFIAPLAYTGIGLLILLNRMVPSRSDEWARWVVVLALGGWIGNFVLSLADHAQNAFFYWAEWIPVIAAAVAIGMLLAAVIDYRNRLMLRLALGLMVLETIVAFSGWGLHLVAIAHNPMSTLWDRIVYGAPVFAPLLFANLAILALVGLAALNSRATLEA